MDGKETGAAEVTASLESGGQSEDTHIGAKEIFAMLDAADNGEAKQESEGDRTADPSDAAAEDEGEKAPAGEKESDAKDPFGLDEDEDGEKKEAGGTDEDLSEDDGSEGPRIDPSIYKALEGNKEATERLKKSEKGLQKLHGQVTEMKPKAEFLDNLNENFGDAKKVKETLAKIVTELTKHHGVTPAELLGDLVPKGSVEAGKPGSTEADEEASGLQPYQWEQTHDEAGVAYPEWQRRGYGSATEMRLHKQLLDDRAERARERAEREAEKKEAERTRAEATRQSEFNQFVDAQAPKIAKAIKTEVPGIKVTRTMVEKVCREHPELSKTNGALAFKKTFPDEYATAKAAAIKQVNGKRAPEIGPSHVTRGRELPSSDEYSSRHAIAQLLG